jgi:hypothetical protein
MKKSVVGVVALASIALVAVAVARSSSAKAGHIEKAPGDTAPAAEATVETPAAE